MYSIFKEIILRHRDMIVYLLFGILTTVVNYLVYLPLHNILLLSGSLSNIIAWGGAVLVAFLTNKPFVFKSRIWSARVVVPEFFKFLCSRVGTGVIETAIIFVTVDIWDWDGNILKIITSIIVVILNYIFSKLFVFQNDS